MALKNMKKYAEPGRYWESMQKKNLFQTQCYQCIKHTSILNSQNWTFH